MNRLVAFVGGLVVVALALLSAVVLLGGGYWLSDRVYDAGLWPLGAVMRVFLLLALVGYVIGIPAMLFSAVAQLFAGEETATKPRTHTSQLAQPGLRVSASQLKEVSAHCNREAPNMACGIMGGVDSIVKRVYAVKNEANSPSSYSVGPADLLRVYKELEQEGSSVVAIYSSRRGAAYPSPTDVRTAEWPNAFYVYVSLDTEPKVRAFRIAGGRVAEHEFVVD